jgi:hypothetical protein
MEHAQQPQGTYSYTTPASCLSYPSPSFSSLSYLLFFYPNCYHAFYSSIFHSPSLYRCPSRICGHPTSFLDPKTGLTMWILWARYSVTPLSFLLHRYVSLHYALPHAPHLLPLLPLLQLLLHPLPLLVQQHTPLPLSYWSSSTTHHHLFPPLQQGQNHRPITTHLTIMKVIVKEKKSNMKQLIYRFSSVSVVW